MNNLIKILNILLISSFLVSAEIIFKSGEIINGEIISQSSDELILKTNYGEVRIDSKNIKTINYQNSISNKKVHSSPIEVKEQPVQNINKSKSKRTNYIKLGTRYFDVRNNIKDLDITPLYGFSFVSGNRYNNFKIESGFTLDNFKSEYGIDDESGSMVLKTNHRIYFWTLNLLYNFLIAPLIDVDMGIGYKNLWLSFAKQEFCADIPSLNWNECSSNIYENDEITEDKKNYDDYNLLFKVSRKLNDKVSLGLDISIGLNPDFLGYMSEIYPTQDKQWTFTRTFTLNFKYGI